MKEFLTEDSRKRFAATVMIAFLATAISILGIQEAGRRAVETPGSACGLADLEKPMIRLEMGKRIALGDTAKARCTLKGLKRELDADNFFLISYSFLNLSFFLLPVAIGRAAPREEPKRSGEAAPPKDGGKTAPKPSWPSLGRNLPAAVWLCTGLLLAIVMLGADWSENQYLYRWICLARKSVPQVPKAPDGLALATALKWGAQAVASALLGLLYLFHRRFAAKLVAVPAFVAAGFLAAGLYERCPEWIQGVGVPALGALWVAILIHAVLVAIEPRLPSLPPADARGGQPHA